ncbi:MAG: hypothetical protein WBQ25_00535 [Nitrososphaeraceae archaeon]
MRPVINCRYIETKHFVINLPKIITQSTCEQSKTGIAIVTAVIAILGIAVSTMTILTVQAFKEQRQVLKIDTMLDLLQQLTESTIIQVLAIQSCIKKDTMQDG